MNILVSQCLLGEPCRYDGRSVSAPAIQKLLGAGHTLIPVCPEVLGGLPIPRPPAEIQKDGRVVNRRGEDVTRQYESGAQAALKIALSNGCRLAVLKARSPACGCRQVYDGTFSKTLVPGLGVAARLMVRAGLRVLDEEELEQGALE